jgi:hypothetical protein
MKAYGGMDVQIHILFTSTRAGDEWSASRLGSFTYSVWGWVDSSRSGRCGENSWPYRDSDSSVDQPVASRYTDYAIPAYRYANVIIIFFFEKFAWFPISYITFLGEDNFHCLKPLMDGWQDGQCRAVQPTSLVLFECRSVSLAFILKTVTPCTNKLYLTDHKMFWLRCINTQDFWV